MCGSYLFHATDEIAQHSTLEIVEKMIDREEMTDELDSTLAIFRVITISVILAIFGQLGGVSFKDLRHCTRLSLRTSRIIKSLGEKVETLLVDGLSFSDVAMVLAYLHAGAQEPDVLETLHHDAPNTTVYDGLSIIGFRNTSYSVLPALLSHLAEGPAQTALGFECFDSFIGNIPVRDDGTIKSTTQESVLFREGRVPKDPMQAKHDDDDSDDEPCQFELGTQKVSIAVPSPRSADVPLYLNIERPVELERPVLGFVWQSAWDCHR